MHTFSYSLARFFSENVLYIFIYKPHSFKTNTFYRFAQYLRFSIEWIAYLLVMISYNIYKSLITIYIFLQAEWSGTRGKYLIKWQFSTSPIIDCWVLFHILRESFRKNYIIILYWELQLIRICMSLIYKHKCYVLNTYKIISLCTTILLLLNITLNTTIYSTFLYYVLPRILLLL